MPSLVDAMSDETTNKATRRWLQIEKFLETNEFIMNADIRTLYGVSAATANRILANLAKDGKLINYRTSGHWVYRIND